jgi:hypothetical protein
MHPATAKAARTGSKANGRNRVVFGIIISPPSNRVINRRVLARPIAQWWLPEAAMSTCHRVLLAVTEQTAIGRPTQGAAAIC